MKIITNLLFNNALLLISWGLIRRGTLDIFSVASIILIIFILPGLGWLGLFIKKQQRSFIEKFFFVVLVSTAAMLAGNCLQVWFKYPLSFSAYFIYLAIVINVGVLFSGNNIKVYGLLSKRMGSHVVIAILAFFSIFIFTYFQAAYYIPALPDNTLTAQQAAYGLKNDLKPHTFSDDGFLTYYFAHPLLMNFYTANAIFLSGHMAEMKYYYDYSRIVNRIYESGPYVGEFFSIYTSPEKKINVKIKEIRGDRVFLDQALPNIYLHSAFPQYAEKLLKDRGAFEINSFYGNEPIYSQHTHGPILIKNKLSDKSMITKNIYEQIQLRIFHDELYNKFYSSPHRLCSRIINIFFVMATLTVMMAIMIQFGLAYSEALLLLIVYISLPEVNIYSIGGSRTAIGGFSLISMVYFYLKQNVRLSFFSGLISALSTHKLAIVPLATVIKQLVSKNSRLNAVPLILGFLTGLAIFWIYSLSIDVNAFMLDHVHYHTLNRIFHIDKLGYSEHYPNLLDYWGQFIANVGWPFFLLSLIPLLYLAKKRDSNLNIFSFWFVTGAVVFSIVDWKETKHLILIVIPLVFGVAYLLKVLKRNKSLLIKLLRLCTIIVLLIILAFNFYHFLSLDGYQMLQKIGTEL